MNKSTEYINLLAAFSCLAVVFLHFNGIFWSHPKGALWVESTIIETIFYFAVPVFLMITGITLIDYRERCSTREFFIRRIKRTVVPFVIWSFIAYLWVNRHVDHIDLSPLHIAKGIVFHRFISIYWFFIPLFAIYLSIPVLSLIQSKIKCFTYMAIYFLVTVSIGEVLADCNIDVIPKGLHLPVCGGFLIYPLLGYVLHNISIGAKGRFAIYLAGILATIAHFYVTAYIPNADGSINCLLKGYLKFPAVLQASAILVFAKYNTSFIMDTLHLRKIVDYIKPTTLSIYLVHIYCYHAMCSLFMDKTSPAQYMTGAVVCFALVVLAVRGLQRLPYGKYFFP